MDRRPGLLRFMGSQRVGHDWVNELNMGPDPSCPLLWPGWLQYLSNQLPCLHACPPLIFSSQQELESSCFRCCCSVSQFCLTLWNPMACSMPGLSVPHHLPKFSQVHVHFIGNIIHASYLLTPSSPSALNLSQNQGLFQWVSCYHQMSKTLEFQLQHQSFQGVFRVDFPYDWLVWFPCCPRDFQESFPDQFEGINSLAFCLLYGPALTIVHDHWEDIALSIQIFVSKVISLLFNTVILFSPNSDLVHCSA